MKNKDNPEDDEETDNYNDMYDVVKASLTVHSKHDTLNPDFTLANLTPRIFQNTAILYIKEHVNVMVALNNYLSNKELEDEEYREKIQKLLLDEVLSLTNLSRADEAKVLNAILDYIRGQGNIAQQPNTETPNERGIIGKTKDFVLGKKQEE